MDFGLLNTGEKKMGTVYAGVRDLKQDPISYIVEPIVNYCLSFDDHFSPEIEFEEQNLNLHTLKIIDKKLN